MRIADLESPASASINPAASDQTGSFSELAFCAGSPETISLSPSTWPVS